MIKLEKPRDGNGDPLPHTDWVYTYYVRDAQGNVMSVYKQKTEVCDSEPCTAIILAEQHIYGSSRLGLRRPDATLAQKTQYGFITLDETDFLKFKRKLGGKEYELTNHLGNVMAVVTDRKITVQGANITCLMQQKPMTDFYIPHVVSYSDYYPFGMQMPDRNDAVSEYRYGFNGMEGDSEVKGQGNSYTTEFRQYDPRLGRWLSLDPLFANFAWQSPYAAFDNNPIYYNDPQGSEAQKPNPKPKYRYIHENRRGNLTSSNVFHRMAKALGRGLRATKNFFQRTFGGRKSKVQTVNLGKWVRDREWTEVLSGVYDGNPQYANLQQFMGGARGAYKLHATWMRNEKGNIFDMSLVSLKGYKGGRFQRLAGANSPMGISGLPSVNATTGEPLYDAISQRLPMLSVTTYLRVKLLLEQQIFAPIVTILERNSTLNGVLDFIRTRPAFMNNDGGFPTSDANTIWGGVMLRHGKISRMYSGVSLLRMQGYVSAPVDFSLNVKFSRLGSRSPNWFQRTFTMNF